MSKKELELFALEFFKEHYEGFPDGELIQDESPDFVINDNGNIIGIEIAEVYQDSHIDAGSELKRQEVSENRFEKRLLNAIEKYTQKNIILSVDFSSHHSFSVNQIDGLVYQCTPHVLEFILNHDEGWTRIVNHPSMRRFPLPKEIDSIYIQLLSPDIPSFNAQSQGGTVSNLEYIHIEQTLLKHEKAMDKYKICNEYWLVIREGNYYAGSFNNVVIETPISSKFDKVFIARIREKKVVTLK